MSRVLDRRPRFDERSRDYPVRGLIGDEVIDQPRMWRPSPVVLDQGREGACVGFGWTGELIGSPYLDRATTYEVGNAYALDVYHAAQAIDRAEGHNWPDGASVLAGAKTVLARGFIGSYRWGFGIEDVRDAVIQLGPVVIGIPWLEDMYETDAKGMVTVGGPVVGGHCLFVYAYRPDHHGERVFRWRNSWGPDYGIHGNGWIRYEDLRDLLADDGEACIPLQRSRVRLTTQGGQ